MTSVTVGDYLLDRRLAVGGMAEVFLGRAIGAGGFEKQVVIKRMLPVYSNDPAFRDMFLDEARIAARFNHPNVVQLHQLVRVDNELAIVMEHIDGLDLRAVVAAARERRIQIPVELACWIVAGVADGLHYVHELEAESGEPLDIIHRDVSPTNVIVTWLGGVKIVDFGIVKHSQRVVATRTGVIKGKLPYLSPEAIAHQPVDRRSDIYALGAVLYELHALTPCFPRRDRAQILDDISGGLYVRLHRHRSDIPAAVERVVDEMLATDPERRPRTAGAVSAALRRIMAETSTPSADDLARFLAKLSTGGATPAYRFSALGNDVEVAVGDEHSDPSEPIPEPTRLTMVQAALTDLDADDTIADEADTTVTPWRAGHGDASADEVRLDPGSPTVSLEPPARAEPTELARTVAVPRASSARTTTTRSMLVGMVVVCVTGVAVLAYVLGTRKSAPPVVTRVVPLPIESVEPTWRDPNNEEPTPVDANQPVEAQMTDRGRSPGPKERRSKKAARKVAEVKAPRPGRITLVTVPSTQIDIDGESVGRSPLTRVRLSAGRHEVELRNPQLGIHKTVALVVTAGETRTKRIVVGKGRIVVHAKPWANVYLRGKSFGPTPIAPIEVYEGTHELLLKNPDRKTARKVRVKVGAGETVGIAEDM